MWSSFILFFLGRANRDDVLLIKLPPKQKSEVWAYFIWWLRAVKGGSHTGATRTLAAVKSLLGQHIGTDNRFANNDVPVIAKALNASAHKTKVELRSELAQKLSRQKLPAFDELTLWIMEKCWIVREWSNKDIADRAVWVAVLLMELFGFRPSNVLKRSAGKNDHTLMYQDVLFYYKLHGRLTCHKGSSEALLRLTYSDIEFLEFQVLSTKNKWFKPTTLTCNTVNERGRNAIRTLLVWCQKYGVGNPEGYITSYSRPALFRKGQPLMTRHATSEEVNGCIKEAAEALGLPGSMYSSKSFRSGLATRDELTGVPIEETMKTGGWHQKKTIKRHYRKASRVFGAKKAGRNHGLTLEEVQAMPEVKRAAGVITSSPAVESLGKRPLSTSPVNGRLTKKPKACPPTVETVKETKNVGLPRGLRSEAERKPVKRMSM